MQCNIISEDTHKKLLLELEEDKLADQLKQLCNETESGKWSEFDPSTSATILHKLGKVYLNRSKWFRKQAELQMKQKTDIEKMLTTQRNEMFALIRCAALYNAAIVRSNEETKAFDKDLKHLCNHVLQLSGAENSDADLVEVAIQVKQKVQKMRTEAGQLLSYVPRVDNAEYDEQTVRLAENNKISHVQNMQKVISDSYRNIMNDLAQRCLSTMGTAPCKFTIVGMGSLARDEVTPYSDFEHIIVLEDDCQHRNDCNKILNYFRWYSVVFHLIIINLQETIVPSVDVYSLNDKSSDLGDWFFDDHTPRGISFDGLMPHASKFPLGRQETENKPWSTELIKPVSKMLEYLNSAESIKNGYHLSDILTRTCYVFGDESVYNHFQVGVSNKLQHQTDQELEHEVKRQVTKDLQNFGTKMTDFDESPNRAFNMKTHIYRSTTIFIAALGRREKIAKSSCFSIINTLARRKKISLYAKKKLRYATAIACEARLRWYMNKGMQKDLFDSEKIYLLDIMSHLVGESSAVSYFQITYALHCDISKRFNLKGFHFQTDPELLNFSLMFSFENMKCNGLNWQTLYKKMHNDKHQNFDECLSKLEKNWNVEKNISLNSQEQDIDNDNLLMKTGEKSLFRSCLYFQCGLYADAVTSYEKDLSFFISKLEEEVKRDGLISNTSIQIIYKINYIVVQTACCYIYSAKKEKALKHLIEWKQMFEELPTQDKFLRFCMVVIYDLIGNCCANLTQYKEAERWFEKTSNLLVKFKFTCDEENTLLSYHLLKMSDCQIELNKNKEGLNNLISALNIFNKTSKNAEMDIHVAICHYKIGNCLRKLNNSNQAQVHFKKSLQIFQKLPIDLKTDHRIAIILFDSGECLLKEMKLESASESFLKAEKILNRMPEENNLDLKIKIFLSLGQCEAFQKRFHHSVGYYNAALKIVKKFNYDETDGSEIPLLLLIANCLFLIGDVSKAQTRFKEAQLLFQKQHDSLKKEKNLKTVYFSLWKMRSMERQNDKRLNNNH